MNLKTYMENLESFVNKHPEALEMEVIYARDDEGNGYQRVNYTPSLAFPLEEGEYHTDSEDAKENNIEPTAVCIN